MVRHFWRQGRKVNRKRIQRLMRLMGIEAVYPQTTPIRSTGSTPAGSET
jgi:hypothetical protein